MFVVGDTIFFQCGYKLVCDNTLSYKSKEKKQKKEKIKNYKS